MAHFSEVDYVEVAETLSMSGARFHYHGGEPKHLFRWQLNRIARAWAYFVSARLLPSSHASSIDREHCFLVYAIMMGKSVDVGRIIRYSIRNISKFNTTAGLAHGTFIT